MILYNILDDNIIWLEVLSFKKIDLINKVLYIKKSY